MSGSTDKTLKVWDIATGQELRALTGHTDWVLSIAITPDGRYAVSGSADKTLKVWDIATGQELRALTGHTDSVWSIAITPDGRYAVSGSADKTLKVWDAFKPVGGPAAAADSAMTGRKGGIDMNPANLNMLIKRDGNGVPLPVSQQNLENIKIDGLVPVILGIKPASATPLFSELTAQNSEFPT